jgi:predicted MFS family arabinose efflux permease
VGLARRSGEVGLISSSLSLSKSAPGMRGERRIQTGVHATSDCEYKISREDEVPKIGPGSSWGKRDPPGNRGCGPSADFVVASHHGLLRYHPSNPTGDGGAIGVPGRFPRQPFGFAMKPAEPVHAAHSPSADSIGQMPGNVAVASSPERGRLSLRDTFSALRHRNYRLWFAGQTVSLFGTWTQTTAQGFLVYELTGSPAYLGYVGFAAGLPSWLFTIYGGVVADRMSRRTLLIITQSVMMLLAFTLSFLSFSGRVQPWHILVLASMLGVATAFDAPTRQAFTLEMVGREDLTNAIALNATMFNAATVVGPAFAGVTYALFGPSWCFLINGVTYLAVIAALLFMRLPPFDIRQRTQSAMQGLRDGLHYVAGNGSVKRLMATVGFYALVGVGFVTLMPVWSVDVLNGDATTNGLLLSARGVGSLIGGLTIAALGHFNVKGRLVTVGSFTMALLLLAFSFVRWLPASLLTIAFVGWGFMLVINTVNALVQVQVPDNLRGRVMGIYTMVFFGAMPLGTLLAGVTAARLGAPATLMIASIMLLGFASLMLVIWPGLRKMT